ncbi:tyrosine-protein phosphatase [Rhizorhapis sp. SPR117]|uniref:tyrosine-protein phosphatase n=1 Tax=Rhizorhapis sp. SPR117 TaxID=2912611 RepID=UPI001F383D9E|nr:tyrosine-protein phosphatase [Rhizorhapis sp. SPR117]
MTRIAADASRLLPLSGGFNLRDFGGYETVDGNRVKTRTLYRSGVMSMLTPEDEAHLATLGIATICDFRRGDERASHPTRWHAGQTSYFARDYSEDTGLLSRMYGKREKTAEMMRDLMIAVYRNIPTDHGPAYRVMFERLAAGHVPMLINCSAGKDRTGVGAALILSALDVPRETILQDYLLTNDVADFTRLVAGWKGRSGAQSPDALAPALTADASYLDAMFDTLDRDHGGLNGYLASIGLDVDICTQIRANLLET